MTKRIRWEKYNSRNITANIGDVILNCYLIYKKSGTWRSSIYFEGCEGGLIIGRLHRSLFFAKKHTIRMANDFIEDMVAVIKKQKKALQDIKMEW